MGSEDVNAILKKAAQDPVFLNSLTRNFDKTVSDHSLDLSAEESNALKAVNWRDTFGNMAAGTWVHVYKTEPSVGRGRIDRPGG